MSNKIIIYTDGGSRGNPGPAGIGGVILVTNNSEIGVEAVKLGVEAVLSTAGILEKKEFSKYIGDGRTNNEAEYEALIYALDQAKKVVGKKEAKKAKVECYLDSELVVKQLNHEYKLRDERIQKYFITIWNLMLDYGDVKFFHVRREQNKEADALVNKILDKQETEMF